MILFEEHFGYQEPAWQHWVTEVIVQIFGLMLTNPSPIRWLTLFRPEGESPVLFFDHGQATFDTLTTVVGQAQSSTSKFAGPADTRI